jgi:hypothetical protein
MMNKKVTLISSGIRCEFFPKNPHSELLRHTRARMTVDTYTQALSLQKRAGQSKVVGMIRPEQDCTRRCAANFA